jgi:DMSO/TMAO reductase YedYZ molybdopterin-dependent catalytic subunit
MGDDSGVRAAAEAPAPAGRSERSGRRERARTLGLGALVGVLCAGVAVGVGEAVAAFVRPPAAPVIAVGNRFVRLTPESVKRWAIRNFGTNDKHVLLTGIYVVLAVFAIVVGILAVRRLVYGLVGIAVFGALGVYAALTQPAAHSSDVVPTLFGATAAAAALVTLIRTLPLESAVSGAETADSRGGVRADGALERRRFLQVGVASAGVAVVGGLGGRAAQHARFDVAAARAKVALPAAVDAAAAPAGADLGQTRLPWQTPNSDFYRIDTALEVPQVNPDTWSLRIHGMVDREVKLSFAELLQRPLIERWITLCCVSNPVGGTLVGNALFRGARLADLLREAGVHDASDQLLMTSVDGMTIGAPTKVVMDGRDALVAVGMNGAPLPVAHGFPARIVVPGLYGYVSACKWVVDIEATTFDKAAAYWVTGGWAQQTDIKLMSRIDTPRNTSKVAAGRPAPIAGVAWDQHVGVSKVEVQVNDGPWLPARLAEVPSTDTWRQWVVDWTPPNPGEYTVRARATDGRGQPQADYYRDVFPSGATGLHTILVHAT